MPTKAGLIKPSDIRHGLTVWRVSQVTDGHGVVSRQYHGRLFCISRFTPVPCFLVIGKDTEVNYIDKMAWFELETGGIMSIESSDMGHDVPGAIKHMPFHNYLFSSEKAALRFANAKNGCHKPSNEEIQFARDHSDYCDQHEGKPPTEWTPLSNNCRRISDRRRYLRIPGQGIHNVIVRENGELVYRERSNLSKAANNRLAALAKRLAGPNHQTVLSGNQWVTPGMKKKVLARLPATKATNRTALKKVQRESRAIIENYVHRNVPVRLQFAGPRLTMEERRQLASACTIVPTTKTWKTVPRSNYFPFINERAHFIMRPPREEIPNISISRPVLSLTPDEALLKTHDLFSKRAANKAVEELMRDEPPTHQTLGVEEVIDWVLGITSKPFEIAGPMHTIESITQFVPAGTLVLKGSEDRNTHIEGNNDGH